MSSNQTKLKERLLNILTIAAIALVEIATDCLLAAQQIGSIAVRQIADIAILELTVEP